MVLKAKGNTQYGIAGAVTGIVTAILQDENKLYPVSAFLEGEYGLSGLALSIPSVVGKNGIEKVLEIPLNEKEKNALLASADQLKAVIEKLTLN